MNFQTTNNLKDYDIFRNNYIYVLGLIKQNIESLAYRKQT